MRPWLGVVAVSAAMLIGPAAAFANDDAPALLKFRLDKREPGATSSSRSGSTSATRTTARRRVTTSSGPPGSTTSSSRSRGRTASRTSASCMTRTTSRASARRASRTRTPRLAAEGARLNQKARAPSAGPGTCAPSAATSTRTTSARFLSIEANVDGAHYTGTTVRLHGPTVTAEWFDAAGNKIGNGNIGVYRDPDVTPDYYQYHYGDLPDLHKGDTGRRARVDEDRLLQGRHRHDQRQGVGREEPAAYTAGLQDRLRHALLRRAGRLPEDRATSPASSPTSRTVDGCPRRPGATSARPRRCSATSTRRPPRRTRPRRTSALTRTTCPSPAPRRPPRRSRARSSSPPSSWATSAATRSPPRSSRPGGHRNQALSVDRHGQRAARRTPRPTRPARSPAPPTT